MISKNFDAKAVCFMIPLGTADAALSLLFVAGVAASAGSCDTNCVLVYDIAASQRNLQFFVIARDDRPSLIFWMILVPKISGY